MADKYTLRTRPRRIGSPDDKPAQRARAIKERLRKEGRRFDDSTLIVRADRNSR